MTSFNQICGAKNRCRSDVLEHTIQLAVEIAREGREEQKIADVRIVSTKSTTKSSE